MRPRACPASTGCSHGHPHPDPQPWRPAPQAIDTGDTAWLLAASALVLLMAPGLALFYGGMVRSKSVLNMMMMTFGALAAITILWVLVGYSIAFGDDVGLGLLGNPVDHFGLQDLVSESADTLADRADHPVRGLPGAVLRHHRRAGQRCHRRPGQVRGLDRLRLGVDAAGLRAGRTLGLRPRPRRAHRRLAGQQDRHHRLRRRHGRGDLFRRLGACARHGRRHAGRASARTRCGRTT